MAAELGGGGIYPPQSCGGGLPLTAARHVVGLQPSRSWVVGGTTHDREPTYPARPLPTTLPASRRAVARSFVFSPTVSRATT